jgi:nucleotide-binding universal stress UspA family protein
LVATDFSENSEKALHHGIAVARRYGAKFYLAHVVSSLGFRVTDYYNCVHASELALEDARRLEAKLVKSGALAGLEHEVVVAIGDLWEQLNRIATEQHVKLIVTGTQGRTGLRKVVMGSAAEAIFRHASCPVLTVGPCAPSAPLKNAALRRILCPTDFSDDSARAVPYALSLASEHEAELTLLHVVEAVTGEAQYDQGRVATALKGRLLALLPSSFASDPSVKVEVALGPIVETILDVARYHSSDLIIMGLKHRATFVDHLPWMHAYRVVSGACCPVLSVRSR